MHGSGLFHSGSLRSVSWQGLTRCSRDSLPQGKCRRPHAFGKLAVGLACRCFANRRPLGRRVPGRAFTVRSSPCPTRHPPAPGSGGEDAAAKGAPASGPRPGARRGRFPAAPFRYGSADDVAICLYITDRRARSAPSTDPPGFAPGQATAMATVAAQEHRPAMRPFRPIRMQVGHRKDARGDRGRFRVRRMCARSRREGASPVISGRSPA